MFYVAIVGVKLRGKASIVVAVVVGNANFREVGAGMLLLANSLTGNVLVGLHHGFESVQIGRATCVLVEELLFK